MSKSSVNVFHQEKTITIYQGDCLDVMRSMPPHSVDALVTDPPYGIRFMGKAWDGADMEKTAHSKLRKATTRPEGWRVHEGRAFAAGTYDLSPAGAQAYQAFSRSWAVEALRVLKPGGHLLAFGSPRMFHRLTCGIEEAGWEIRDCLMWLFGSGFPKSLDVSKAIDGEPSRPPSTAPATDSAKQWAGWGTALKPAYEPILLARKPLEGTVAENVLKCGTGALNIDACRTPCGRWPANVLHDGSAEVLSAFPDAPGQQADASTNAASRRNQHVYGAMRRGRGTEPSANSKNGGAVGFKMKPGTRRLDQGSAARFFYTAKATSAERNGPLGASNSHPTVKPLTLMLYLLQLIVPPGGLVLDPFLGSGTTLVAAKELGMTAIGCDQEKEYCGIAVKRLAQEVLPL